MKPLISMIVVLCAAGILRADDDPEIPAGVHYKKTSAEVNDAAKQKILRTFTPDASDKDVLAFFEPGALVCGPGLWQNIKDDPSLAPMSEGRVTFQVPVIDRTDTPTRKLQELTGQLFQSDREVLAFWKVFVGHSDLKQLKVRKLTSSELKLYWAIISFDITEPVFIVEAKDRKVIVQFTSPENLRVVWIDDFSKMNLTTTKPSAQGAGEAAEPKVAALNRLRLYIPDPQLKERFGDDVDPLFKYINKLKERTSDILAKDKAPTAKGLLIAVGIKSRKNTRISCQAVDGDIPTDQLRRLESELAKIDAVDLKKGPAAFGMEMKLFGNDCKKFPEFPDIWLDAAKKNGPVKIAPPDELFKIIWPDE